MQKDSSIWYSISIVGLITHSVFWLVLGRLAESYSQKVWEAIARDPNFVPAYESWEAKVNYSWMVAGTIPLIYLPAIIASVTAVVLPVNRRRRSRVAVWAVGASLGILSVLYAVLLIMSKP